MKRVLLALAIGVAFASGAAVAVSSTDEQVDIPPDLMDEAMGTPASSKFDEKQREVIDSIPVGQRLDFTEVPCDSIDFGNPAVAPKGCINVRPVEEILEVAPEASAAGIQNWEGDNVVPTEIQREECAFLQEMDPGFKGEC